jgi:hypothetical protein
MESGPPSEPFDDALFDFLFDPVESDRKREPWPVKESEQGPDDGDDAPRSAGASASPLPI